MGRHVQLPMHFAQEGHPVVSLFLGQGHQVERAGSRVDDETAVLYGT